MSDFILQGTRLNRPPRPSGFWIAVASLIALFGLTALYWLDWHQAQDVWPASGAALFERGEWARAYLSAAAHADPRHLLANSLLFFIFALLLGGYFGPLAFPVVPLLLTPFITVLTVYNYAPETQLIGASGAVNAMVGEWLTLYWFTARDVRGRLRALRTIGFALATLVPETVDPARSDLAHAIGFCLGIAAGFPTFWILKRGIRADETWVAPPVEPDSEADAGLFGAN